MPMTLHDRHGPAQTSTLQQTPSVQKPLAPVGGAGARGAVARASTVRSTPTSTAAASRASGDRRVAAGLLRGVHRRASRLGRHRRADRLRRRRPRRHRAAVAVGVFLAGVRVPAAVVDRVGHAVPSSSGAAPPSSVRSPTQLLAGDQRRRHGPVRDAHAAHAAHRLDPQHQVVLRVDHHRAEIVGAAGGHVDDRRIVGEATGVEHAKGHLVRYGTPSPLRMDSRQRGRRGAAALRAASGHRPGEHQGGPEPVPPQHPAIIRQTSRAVAKLVVRAAGWPASPLWRTRRRRPRTARSR